jgi:hypothetical protein
MASKRWRRRPRNMVGSTSTLRRCANRAADSLAYEEEEKYADPRAKAIDNAAVLLKSTTLTCNSISKRNFRELAGCIQERLSPIFTSGK